VNEVCPTCSGSSANLTCRVKVEVMVEERSMLETVMFENDVRLVFGQVFNC